MELSAGAVRVVRSDSVSILYLLLYILYLLLYLPEGEAVEAGGGERGELARAANARDEDARAAAQPVHDRLHG